MNATSQPTTLEIADGDQRLTFSYRQALDYHKGNAYWGCALAFRMLQRAAGLLSRKGLWDRNRLQVTSGHPGPGVRDTLELVTGCVSDGRFTLDCESHEARCVGNMQYAWTLSDGTTEVSIKLMDTLVPDAFLQLLDKIDHNPATPDEQARLERFKQQMTGRIWEMTLEEAFPDSGIRVRSL
jgi:hypothetical protein